MPKRNIYLVICIDLGYGVDEDKKEANKWYRKALKWYRKVAEQGDAEAQDRLGDMYRLWSGRR